MLKYDDSREKVEEKLPTPMENIFCMLNNKEISDNDQKQAQTVWNKFNKKDIEEYLELL